MADALRLKVSTAEYLERIGILDSKINDMRTLLGEYEALKNDATKVLGENDSNLEKLKQSVQQNINAVNAQMTLLIESRGMLQRQMDGLGMLSTNTGNMIDQAMQTAKTAYNTIKIVGDMVR